MKTFMFRGKKIELKPIKVTYTAIEKTPEHQNMPEDIIDKLTADAWEACERDYNALPYWKQLWHRFIVKTGWLRLDNFIIRLRRRWRRRKEEE